MMSFRFQAFFKRSGALAFVAASWAEVEDSYRRHGGESLERVYDRANADIIAFEVEDDVEVDVYGLDEQPDGVKYLGHFRSVTAPDPVWDWDFDVPITSEDFASAGAA